MRQRVEEVGGDWGLVEGGGRYIGRSQPTDWLVECCFTSTETVGLLGTGAQGGHLDFHTAHEL